MKTNKILKDLWIGVLILGVCITVALFIRSRAPAEPTYATYKIIEVDSCEYVIYKKTSSDVFQIKHKKDCKYCIEITKYNKTF